MDNISTSPEEIQPSKKAGARSENTSKNIAEKPAKVPALPKPPTYRIAAKDGKEIKKPLTLIGGKAYATTWQIVEKKETETVDKDGNLIVLDPPEITSEEKKMVVGSDGTVYGLYSSIDDLDIKIHMREKISEDNNWSAEGLNRFLAKDFPDPKVVFRQLVEIIDHFIDFYKSLADQPIMCEFIACWTLATWLLDAFKIAGYLWITGERGSGKTNLLNLISQLSYLGLLISQSGSFASLRDMADYAATLAFDEAENITDREKIDPDKMALLLAGNRKGHTIPVKVQDEENHWRIRYVNTYCARAFTAIRIPDPTMASRCIILPMLRTPDKSKANIDPSEMENWPYDRRRLIDDLWSLGLSKLPLLSNWDKWVGKNAKLIGRNLQPWRPVLAVAIWMEKCGVEGLYARMEKLALDYQKERPDLETADTTRVVIQALCSCANAATRANRTTKKPGQFIVKVANVTAAAAKIIEEEDLDLEARNLDKKRVGRILAKLRFPEAPRPGGKGSRQRVIDLKDLEALAGSYNVVFLLASADTANASAEALAINGPDGTNGTTGTKEFLQIPLEVTEEETSLRPSGCYRCGGSSFWQRADGEWLCKICQPKPPA